MVAATFTEIVDSGIDYITATVTHSDNAQQFQRLGKRWLHQESLAGNDCVKWGSHGYEGLIAGSVQLGVRADGVLLRVTGPMAQLRAKEILEFATNVSRLDCQTTVRVEPVDYRFAEYVERRALKHKKKFRQNHAVRLLRDSLSGNTVYFGRRVSDRFIRVYDKGRESRLPELRGCWRSECQYNGKLAWAMAHRLNAGNFNWTDTERVVYLELLRKGVPWVQTTDRPRATIQGVGGPTKSDFRRRLAWLSEQVRPTVQREVAKGHLKEVLEALGLDTSQVEGKT